VSKPNQSPSGNRKMNPGAIIEALSVWHRKIGAKTGKREVLPG